MHNWRTSDGFWRTTSMLYYEHREAEFKAFTYNEVGIRLIGRRKMTESIDLVGRLTTFVRDYEDGIRDDRRFRGTLGFEWDLGQQVVLEGFGGYQRNWSMLATKDYGGAVLGVAVKKVF